MNAEQKVAAMEAELDTQIVAELDGQPVTRGTLSAAFDRVSDPKDWRAGIFAYIAPDEVAVTAEAIRFFTGTEPRTRRAGKHLFYIAAAGYRNGPCGP